jgi:ABC-type spermidine/putrescine transport system permease subunit II
MVAGAFENGPVFIRNARLAGQEGPLVLVSTVLIFASFAIFVLISVLGPRLRLPLRRVWPGFEKRLSSPSSAKVKDGIALTVFLFFCGLPSLFTAVPGLAALLGGTAASALTGVGVWSGFWISIAYSYGIGLSATLLNLVVGFPMAVLIARRRLGAHFGALLDSLINVPIVIPSIALGVSLNYFWSAFGSLPELWVLILVHTSITYTYFVRAMVAAIEYVPEELEDVARTLGSRPFEVFRKIVLPLTKYSIFAGSIMVLTRSVDETGATIAVARQVKTAPVLLAEWISRPDMYGPSTVGLGVSILVFSAFISLLLMRLVLRRSA